jgi:2-dehydro-3-deoxyglucarate aldolase/4-hydroxy-2-oxoheptanedioate aldolase
MENAKGFRQKVCTGQVCVGTNITFTDLTATEALSDCLDFVWIDMEHNALSLEAVQGHIIAAKCSDTAALVRVPWNDPVLIKPVLDIGADGVIAPFVRTVEDVRLAVAACRYPPEGIRGHGPRRPSNYGRTGGASYCRAANESVLCIVQIEHVDAVNNLDEILAVPGLDGVAVGPMDLSGSLGHMAEPDDPAVAKVIGEILAKARRAGVMAGIGLGNDPEKAASWIDKGAQWVSLGSDYSLMIETAERIAGRVRSVSSAVSSWLQ